MSEQSRIVIRRSSEFLNRARGFKVMINGDEKGIIKNGATEDYQIEPGIHQVKCKIDWTGSNEVTVSAEPGKTSYLYVRSSMKYYWHLNIPLFIVVFLNLYYKFTKTPEPAFFPIVLIVVILISIGYMLYYTLFNRNKYLTVEEDKEGGFGS